MERQSSQRADEFAPSGLVYWPTFATKQRSEFFTFEDVRKKCGLCRESRFVVVSRHSVLNCLKLFLRRRRKHALAQLAVVLGVEGRT